MLSNDVLTALGTRAEKVMSRKGHMYINTWDTLWEWKVTKGVKVNKSVGAKIKGGLE